MQRRYRRCILPLTVLIVTVIFTVQPLIMLCVHPLHINDREARDRAYHDRRTAGLSPDPATHSEAVVQVFAARAWGIRGAFAEHTWIAYKQESAAAYTVCQVKGWLLYEQGCSPLEVREGTPDRYWMGNAPRLLNDLRGEDACRAITGITRAIATSPCADEYRVWPGPNSNTFTAHVLRQVPELGCKLPVTAIGKDFLPDSGFFTRTPSSTGYQVSLFGLAALSAARTEGLELSLLGLTVRLDIHNRRLYLPGSYRPVLQGPARTQL